MLRELERVAEAEAGSPSVAQQPITLIAATAEATKAEHTTLATICMH